MIMTLKCAFDDTQMSVKIPLILSFSKLFEQLIKLRASCARVKV